MLLVSCPPYFFLKEHVVRAPLPRRAKWGAVVEGKGAISENVVGERKLGICGQRGRDDRREERAGRARGKLIWEEGGRI